MLTSSFPAASERFSFGPARWRSIRALFRLPYLSCGLSSKPPLGRSASTKRHSSTRECLRPRIRRSDRGARPWNRCRNIKSAGPFPDPAERPLRAPLGANRAACSSGSRSSQSLNRSARRARRTATRSSASAGRFPDLDRSGPRKRRVSSRPGMTDRGEAASATTIVRNPKGEECPALAVYFNLLESRLLTPCFVHYLPQAGPEFITKIEYHPTREKNARYRRIRAGLDSNQDCR